MNSLLLFNLFAAALLLVDTSGFQFLDKRAANIRCFPPLNVRFPRKRKSKSLVNYLKAFKSNLVSRSLAEYSKIKLVQARTARIELQTKELELKKMNRLGLRDLSYLACILLSANLIRLGLTGQPLMTIAKAIKITVSNFKKQLSIIKVLLATSLLASFLKNLTLVMLLFSRSLKFIFH